MCVLLGIWTGYMKSFLYVCVRLDSHQKSKPPYKRTAEAENVMGLPGSVELVKESLFKWQKFFLINEKGVLACSVNHMASLYMEVF